MTRPVLDEALLHAAVRPAVDRFQSAIVAEVEAARTSAPVLVVGMAMNPFCRRARRSLDAAGVDYRYIEYGSYLSEWKPRLALKMWSGWPTFPMVFVRGVLIGGANDLSRLIDAGELRRLLSPG